MIITIFVGSDWEGIYFDNDLWEQGHSVDIDKAIKEYCLYKNLPKGMAVHSIEYIHELGDWLQIEGYLPTTLDEVKELNKL